ncbi:FAD-dependent oxidoreductase [Aeromicrobium sp. CF3.5]|uniref:FAD-dependent oxidoreductase n=1 Tax=Aeromicrobium sp. CF3.5 TaxID=3373078 RepID=UPI003EE782A1
MNVEIYDAVVIGAGQAGLSASYHLRRRGLSHVVLDADDRAGGAWQHRWDALTMHDVHGVADLPGLELSTASEGERANTVVPAYFDRYERRFELPVVRPVRVASVQDEGGVLVTTAQDSRSWDSRTLVNATGTWTRPFVPRYPGQEIFAGRQLHTVDYPGPAAFSGRRVIVVGGGASAVQLAGAIAPVAESLTWVTRSEPVWRTGPFTAEIGREVVAKVEERVRAGLPPRSVVSVTGLMLRDQEREAEAMGVYARRRPMFDRLEADGARWSDGKFVAADIIVWATGFRPAIEHLAPLHLRGPLGGIQLDGTTAVVDPRVQMVGYGPSASTIGANRAGRTAAQGVSAWLGRGTTDPRPPPAGIR